jgi:D-3-phosphoglycerate dehydrogenase / 2-oxoglutarate reductase
MPHKVLITDYYYPTLDEERRVFAGTGIEIVDGNGRCTSAEDVVALGADADALITQFVPIGRSVIERLRRCKVIVRYAIGLDTIDIAAATERRIMVANVPDYCLDEVSDHAMALMLALLRKVPMMDREARAGIWSYKKAVPIRRFSELTLGLLAFGNVAKRVAAKAEAFGIKRILVHDPYVQDSAGYPRYEFVSLEQLAEQADIISVHVPANTETRHMINKQFLQRLKPGSFLINTSRGAVVSEADLLEAVRAERLGGVALDVLENEQSVTDHPLFGFENVIITPHMAWYSTGAIAELQRKVAEQVKQALLEGRPKYWVNPF